jgi:hypothetical protein
MISGKEIEILGVLLISIYVWSIIVFHVAGATWKFVDIPGIL